jgi:hypothetical protein
VDNLHEELGRMPGAVEELVRKGYVEELPEDPYGGNGC